MQQQTVIEEFTAPIRDPGTTADSSLHPSLKTRLRQITFSRQAKGIKLKLDFSYLDS